VRLATIRCALVIASLALTSLCAQRPLPPPDSSLLPPVPAKGIPAPTGTHVPLPKPINLKVLSPDIAITDLERTMVGFNIGLGQDCTFCHAPKPNVDPATYDLDYASDANPEKLMARIMMQMTNDINSKYVARVAVALPHRTPPVTCGTCHQGMIQVPPFPRPNTKKDRHHKDLIPR